MTTTTPPSAATRPCLVARTRPVDAPRELLDHLGSGGFAWFAGDVALVTDGVAALVTAAEAEAVLGTIEHVGERPHAAAGAIAVGALPFSGAGHLTVPARVTGCTPDGRAWVTEIAPQGVVLPPPTSQHRAAPAGPAARFALEEHPDADGWTANVTAALDLVERGELAKVVLARELVVEADAPFDVAAVLAWLRDAQPGCTVYADGGFVGATPELLVARHGHDVVSRPMAGSVPRAEGAADDAAVARLLASPKEDVEHRLLVDAVRRTLAEAGGEVEVTEPEAVRFASVTHLATTVTARLDDPTVTALDLALALHPTPAVGGEPQATALAVIARLEGFDRGRYGGPVGWVSAGGDGEFAVALRCADLDGSRARLLAGAGIVAGSDPASEWAETQAKLEPMRRALVGPR